MSLREMHLHFIAGRIGEDESIHLLCCYHETSIHQATFAKGKGHSGVGVTI